MIHSQLGGAETDESGKFVERHIGPTPDQIELMLNFIGYSDMKSFVEAVVPQEILFEGEFEAFSFQGCEEYEALEELRLIAQKNRTLRSLIGLGYHGTQMPLVIQRHIFENPSWYTAYTPYQAEISQGRLEALFNFQTLISGLTALPIANASLLDEATASAEAMSLSFGVNKNAHANRFLVDKEVLPQTLAVLKTRAEPLGIILEIFEPKEFDLDESVFGVFLQLPGCNGRLWNPASCIDQVHKVGALAIASIDPLAQVLMTPVGELGVDIAVGSMQRFGVPYGFGGPHSAFFATLDKYKRQIPGRVVGQSKDSQGNNALRLALQTREQHIRRDKATSNICTAQVLLAIIASFYAIYHGPDGLQRIASRIVNLRKKLEIILRNIGFIIDDYDRFDSIDIYSSRAPFIIKKAEEDGFNLRILPLGVDVVDAQGFGVTLDELSSEEEINILTAIFAKCMHKDIDDLPSESSLEDENLLGDMPLRTEPFLQQSIFTSCQSETDLIRYIYRLAKKDFSLVDGMIPLGSCTMKLNAAAELAPISWKNFSSVHPFVPQDQVNGYKNLINDLEKWIASITGFSAVSFQPNAGSQGEFAGLLVIKKWHEFNGNKKRNICLIPTSAHGTNPASAVMTGMKVVPISCDFEGNVDLLDLEVKAQQYSENLSALMITYPSTHGVFESKIQEICEVVHRYGGQVYLDGANFNAQAGICRPIDYGVDICHLNLHKTFCIPHGGGGPGVGPIAAAKHLKPFLPGHPFLADSTNNRVGAVSAAPFGSAGILPIAWMYLRMMGVRGLRQASSVALLSANYIAKKLNPHYPVLFNGRNGLVAHECILDLRKIKQAVAIEVDDIAKRLMDYGFHAPTVSWPVAGTMMVEPTESEGLDELNRFCNAMIAIRSEIKSLEDGDGDLQINPLKLSPHTLSSVIADEWNRPYSRKVAAFPLPNQQENKFWPSVSRIDNAFGDRNLICTCLGMDEFKDSEK